MDITRYREPSMFASGTYKLMTTGEIADVLRVHPVTVRGWARRSVVRAYWVGSSWRFRLPDVLEDLAARRAPATPPERTP